MENLPEGDIYLIENYMKMQKNMNVVGANLFYVKLQTIAMLIALINSSKTFNSSDTMRKWFNNVYIITMYNIFLSVLYCFRKTYE